MVNLSSKEAEGSCFCDGTFSKHCSYYSGPLEWAGDIFQEPLWILESVGRTGANLGLFQGQGASHKPPHISDMTRPTVPVLQNNTSWPLSKVVSGYIMEALWHGLILCRW